MAASLRSTWRRYTAKLKPAEWILQVTFEDEASATLLSGSADGQLAVFDLSGGLDEDDAFQVSTCHSLLCAQHASWESLARQELLSDSSCNCRCTNENPIQHRHARQDCSLRVILRNPRNCRCVWVRPSGALDICLPHSLLLKAGLNLDDAVARMGLFSPERRRLWVTTGTEALYAWDWAAARDEITEGAHFRP